MTASAQTPQLNGYGARLANSKKKLQVPSVNRGTNEFSRILAVVKTRGNPFTGICRLLEALGGIHRRTLQSMLRPDTFSSVPVTQERHYSARRWSNQRTRPAQKAVSREHVGAERITRLMTAGYCPDHTPVAAITTRPLSRRNSHTAKRSRRIPHRGYTLQGKHLSRRGSNVHREGQNCVCGNRHRRAGKRNLSSRGP